MSVCRDDFQRVGFHPTMQNVVNGDESLKMEVHYVPRGPLQGRWT